MKRSILGVGALMVIGFAIWAPSRTESQQLRYDFANDTQGWEGLPSNRAAKLSLTRDPEAGGSGNALEVRYHVEKGKVFGVRRMVSRVEGAGLRVSVKTDAATVVVFGLIEADGSAYNKVVFTNAGEWQVVSAPFSEFELAKDSKDENGRLDLDQVRALIIADGAGFMGAASGDHRLWIANYEIGSRLEPVANTGAGNRASQSAVLKWNFDTGPDGWIVVPPPGGAAARLSVTPVKDNAAVGSGALSIRYRVEKKKLAGVLHPVNGVTGVGVHTVLMTHSPTVVVLGLVERDGSSYNYAVHMKADEWQDIEVLFQNFSLAEDSKDENGRLDPDQIYALVVGDAAGFLGDGGGEHELLIGSYEIVSKSAAPDKPGKGYVPLLTTGTPAESGARATVGISYVPGKFQQGFLADGPGELVAVPTRGLGREEGTIELWISPRFDMKDVRDFTGLVTMQAEPFATGFKTSLLVFYSKARQIVFLVNADNDRALSTPALEWKAGEWHHLAVSWGPRGTRLYLDGRIAAENRRGEAPGALAADIVLGNHSWSLLSQRFANTVIDDFRLSKVQREDREIEATARSTQPLARDERTVALEHFDGTPGPPLTLTAETEPFHVRSPGKGASWTAVAPARFPAGATLSYSLATANGTVVDRGEKPAPAGEDRVAVPVPSVEAPGFYRVDLRLKRGETVLNTGQDWIRLERAEGAAARGDAAFFFGASASSADSEDHEEFFRRAAAAGVRSVRMPFEWAELEPRRDEFVWDRYDRIVGWAKKYGIEIVPTLFWENPKPAWAGKGKASELSSDVYPPEDLKVWGDFVSHVVAHYKGTIRWWIPANEPNLPRYWYPKPDARAYVALLKATRAAALRADPEAKILGLSVSGVDLRYLEEALKAGALDACDAVGLHPYRGASGPDERVPINILDPGSSPGTFLDGVRAFRNLMEKYGGGKKKLWLDEVGQPYRDDFIIPNWGVPEETAAAYLVKIHVESKASGLVDRILWYSFWGGEYGSFSLLTPDGRPTLPFVAYAATADRLAGAEAAGEGGRGGEIRSVKFSSSKTSTEVLWSLRGTKEIALQSGERAFNLYGFPIEEANGARRLKLTTLPSFIVRSKS